MTTVRKGQFPNMLSREQFHERFRRSFFNPEHDAIVRLEAIARDIYCKGRKSPVTQKAGPEFQDPDYDMSVVWRATHD